MGLLDNFNLDDPKTMGLLNAGLGIMGQAGDPTRQFSLGQALSGGLNAYAGTIQDAKKQKQLEEALRQKQMHDNLMMQSTQMDLSQKQKAIDDQELMRRTLMNYRNGASSNQMQQGQLVTQGQQGQGFAPQGKLGAIQKQINDFNAQADYFDSQGVVGSDAFRAKAIELEKLKPKFSSEPKVVMGKDGKPMLVQMADDGTVMPMQGYGVASELSFGDTGQNLIGRDKYTGETKISTKKQQSLESLASNSVAMRGQNMTDARMRDATEVNRDNKQLAETQKRDEKAAANELANNGKIASFDTMLNSLDRLKNHKGLDRSVGLYSSVPTMPGSDSANFQAELDTFQSQAFLPMVSQLKGMGALSDSEGKKLTAAVGALNPKMSPQAFRDSLDRINTEMTAAKERVIKSTGKSPDNTPKASMRFNPSTGKLERVE